MIKFSVIIPVYNVEEYIGQCVESVLEQSYKEFEIILIDDGSPDNCPNICEEYSKYDNRVKVIHKKNGGLSSARNAGLKIARGEYIIFLDSDDWLEMDFIKNINTSIMREYVDVVVVNVKSYIQDKSDYHEKKYLLSTDYLECSGIDAFKYLYNKADFWGAAWQFVVRKDYLFTNKLKFINGIYHEDERFSPELLLLADSVGFCKNAYYVNRSGREGSIINSLNIKKEFDKIYIIKDLVKLSNSSDFQGIKSELLLYRCSQLYVGLILSSYKYFVSKDIDFIRLEAELRSLSNILKYNKKIKYKLFRTGIKIFGIKRMGKILSR